MRIGQQSMSRGAYQYWQAIQNITSNVGSVFDVAPATFTSNLHNASPTGPPLLGFFQVSARLEKVVYINRLRAPLRPFVNVEYPYWNICEPCTESLYRTALRPVGWQ
ncbi:DUF4249 domain-containing protein [Arundinibacter roseus]|uniref:DUF4249 family protein n=1 Tax=Arundinibacter roseus TaxID=2070510 RepID=A0A4R4KLP1_9BACT|nr:DUF4249 family protein [Arundinibacter roseus]TDB67852.1 DUF4249 family protein [Arundinibacter roseus]